jgi:nucleotide-binding universal stress UspA family protein
MRVFRRSRERSIEDWRRQISSIQRVASGSVGRTSDLSDSDAIVVAVDGRPDGWIAVDWAAAEAASRKCALRIVHVINWPAPVVNVYGGISVDQWDASVQEAGEAVLATAVDRACLVAPGLDLSTRLHLGRMVPILVRESRQGALVVLGWVHSGGRRNFVSRWACLNVIRLANCAVAIVELSNEAVQGPSAGRVVVSLDCSAGPDAVLEFAFRAAHRRGIGITALHVCSSPHAVRYSDLADPESPRCGLIAASLHVQKEEFPGVDIRHRFVVSAAGSAIIAESSGAALVVLGSRAHRRQKP